MVFFKNISQNKFSCHDFINTILSYRINYKQFVVNVEFGDLNAL